MNLLCGYRDSPSIALSSPSSGWRGRLVSSERPPPLNRICCLSISVSFLQPKGLVLGSPRGPARRRSSSGQYGETLERGVSPQGVRQMENLSQHKDFEVKFSEASKEARPT